jgi:putative oxidoreductase
LGFRRRLRFPYCGSSIILQRLYSTFANGLPGKGLFILRAALSAFLISDARAALMESRQASGVLPALVAAGVGVFFFLGLWTPVAGGLVALLELYLVFFRQGGLWASLLAAAIATGLALLGPGSWSIDAHTYGRKRISLQDR